MSLNSSYSCNCAKHGLPSIVLIRVPQIYTMSFRQRKPDEVNVNTYFYLCTRKEALDWKIAKRPSLIFFLCSYIDLIISFWLYWLRVFFFLLFNLEVSLDCNGNQERRCLNLVLKATLREVLDQSWLKIGVHGYYEGNSRKSEETFWASFYLLYLLWFIMCMCCSLLHPKLTALRVNTLQHGPQTHTKDDDSCISTETSFIATDQPTWS